MVTVAGHVITRQSDRGDGRRVVDLALSRGDHGQGTWIDREITIDIPDSVIAKPASRPLRWPRSRKG